MKPNIFEIATKELNQDAFITWLLQYADPENKEHDEDLHICATKFVEQLIDKQYPDFNEDIVKVKAGRQWRNIDVWAEINDKYLLIIEDKTNTSHHSDQLARYKNTSIEWCNENGYQSPICIYLKTGNESQTSLTYIIKQGFAIYNRQDFIKLLSNHINIKNEIFIDFYERLTRLEKVNNQFETKKIGKWNGDDWQGFFQYLEKNMKLVNWHYVNNPRGGFWNAILNWDYWGIYPAYLQIEEGKLCFKISTDPDEYDMPEDVNRSEIRNKFHNLVMNKATELVINTIKKPSRFGKGNYMTAALVHKKDWLGADDNFIKKEQTLQELEKYIQFLRDII